MKKEFIGFYNPTDIEINEAWNNGIFAFDANTLLNLYRYTEVTRNDFLSTLKTIKDKLFIPYQSAYEYQNNRLSVIDKLHKSYSELIDFFKSNDKELKDQVNRYKKHPSIEIEKIFKLHSEFSLKITKELEHQKKNHPDFKAQDEVLNELTSLFENRIGKEFSKDCLKKIYLEGKERYAESIPPGYKDAENKKKLGDRHTYGDLIIWKELINYSIEVKKPLIFVTDDAKGDWWKIQDGKTIRPREELIKEFFDQTGIRILIYNADKFLHYAKERKLVPQIKEDTIEEVKEVRISDENINLDTSNIIKSATFATNPGYFTNFNNFAKTWEKIAAMHSYSDILNNSAKTAEAILSMPYYSSMLNNFAKISDAIPSNSDLSSVSTGLIKNTEIVKDSTIENDKY